MTCSFFKNMTTTNEKPMTENEIVAKFNALRSDLQLNGVLVEREVGGVVPELQANVDNVS